MPAKSVKINTPEINQAIRTAVENAGGVEAFAELLTCSHSTISKYKSGQIEDVHAATWKRLLPLIQEYLPREGKLPFTRSINSTVLNSNLQMKHFFNLSLERAFVCNFVCNFSNKKNRFPPQRGKTEKSFNFF